MTGHSEQRAVEWTQTGSILALSTLTLLCGASIVAFIFSPSIISIALAVIFAVGTALLSGVKITIDNTHDFMTWNCFTKFPRGKVALSSIRRVQVVRPHLPWLRFGYRGSQADGGRYAVILTDGPAVKMELRNGGVLTISTRHAHDIAAVLDRTIITET